MSGLCLYRKSTNERLPGGDAMLSKFCYLACASLLFTTSSLEGMAFRRGHHCQPCYEQRGCGIELCQSPGFTVRVEQGTVENGQPITIQVTPIVDNPMQIFWSIDAGRTWSSSGNTIVYNTAEPGLVNFTVVAISLDNGEQSEPQYVSARVLKPNPLALAKTTEPSLKARLKTQRVETRGGGYFWNGKTGCWEIDSGVLPEKPSVRT